MLELKEGVHYYIDESGLIVLTREFHVQRGYCCGMGCRHCPFGYEQVPEPMKTQLIQQLNQSNRSKKP